VPGKPAQPNELEAMFQYFLAGHTQAEVSEKFQRDPHTICIIASRERWEEKKQAAHAKALELIGNKYAREMAKTIRGMIFRRDFLQQKLVEEIKKSGRDGLAQGERWSAITSIEDRLIKLFGPIEKHQPQTVINADNVQVNQINTMERELSADELRAIVDEAHKRRLKIKAGGNGSTEDT